MTTQFDQIYHGNALEVGKFRVAQSGMAWKGVDSEGVVTITSADVKWAQWMRVARDFQLRIGLKDHSRENFQGFQREDHGKISSLLKNHFGITLEIVETSHKGWNWGETDFRGPDFVFMVSNKLAFELPLRHVTNSNIAGRTEVSLEFSNPSSSTKAASKSQADEMVEIRFHVPGTHKSKGSDAGSDNDNDDEEEMTAAQVFHDMVKDKAEIGQVLGDMILSFEEVLVLTPRGRYDMDMFRDFLRLRGKKYDYKILYTSISRLFLLPMDDQHVLFILALSTPIRQGQTRYQYLVMQFSREEEITAELNLAEDEVAKYDRLKKNYEDPTFEVISSVFRALSRKKIIGSGSFQTRAGHPALKANLKAIQGDLFVLEKYIFFVSKQPTLVEITDIHQVTFSRVGSSMGAAAARTFDLKITTKSGPEYQFTSLNKEEHENIETYLKEKKVKVKNEMIPDAELLAAAVDVDDDDDEMQSISSEDDEPRKKTIKRTGDDDEDSEDDEDFRASSEDDGGSTSGSESEGGAATASDASGDRDFVKKKQQKAKGKGKEKEKEKERDKEKEKGDGAKPAKKKAPAKKSDDDEEDEPAAKKKAAPKPKPKPKAKAKSDDEMEVDDEKPKPRPKPKPKVKKGDPMDVDDDRPKPKPKPKPKKPEGDAEPPKKKVKTSD